jgi:hypothetical protein
MKSIQRREFLKVAGAGAAAVVGTAATGSVVELLFSGGERRLRFTATVGLPRPPLPAYASYVVKGDVDLRARTGILTSDLFAGAPGAMSGRAFPGLSRQIQLNAVREAGDGTIYVSGDVQAPFDALPGENSRIQLALIRANGTAEASFFGHPVEMQLVERAQ